MEDDMAIQLVIALAGALAGAPMADATPLDEDYTDTEAMSVASGQVLGAATMCDNIPKERVKAAAAKIGELTQRSASDDDELASAQDLFKQAFREGGDAIASGELDCDHASLALTDMEEALK
jgi:hypothetical protein